MSDSARFCTVLQDTAKYFSGAVTIKFYHKPLASILKQNWVISLIVFITYTVITGKTNCFTQLDRKVSITGSKLFVMSLNLRHYHTHPTQIPNLFLRYHDKK